jgi:hypothetical protein
MAETETESAFSVEMKYSIYKWTSSM